MSNIPSSLSYIQLEGAEFKSPVSESLVQSIGGTINGLLDRDFSNYDPHFATVDSRLSGHDTHLATHDSQITTINADLPTRSKLLPVGTVLSSLLSESQFNAIVGFDAAGWVLCDGRSLPLGSSYVTLTGNTTAPDMRGRYQRGKDNGASRDSHGDLALGASYDDQNRSHNHIFHIADILSKIQFKAYQNQDTFATGPAGIRATGTTGADVAGVSPVSYLPTDNPAIHTFPLVAFGDVIVTDVAGAAEANPKTIVLNYYMRYN